jgi:hypothetical protein
MGNWLMKARACFPMASRAHLLGVALILFAGQAGAQAQRPQLSLPEAQRLEAALTSNAHDRAARSALLDYYFLGRMDPALAVPARRRHILWLIENTPEDELAGGPAATIDGAGHSLADPQGFKLASDAWRAQAAKRDVKPATLLNAAYFFKTDDKAFTISLLERALALEPASKEIAARLGDEYALVIMGVTMVNKNGYPLRSDPNLTQSALAMKAREALSTSRNPYVLAKAGYMLLWQGAVLYYSHHLPFDTAPLAKSALDRAVSFAHGDREVANYREQYDAWLREKDAIAGGKKAASPAPREPPRPAVPQAPPPAPSPVQAAQARAITAEDLTKVAQGMSRDELLKLGSPAGRITTDEDGHLIEIFEYSANGTRLGTVRLTDGIVSSLRIP